VLKSDGGGKGGNPRNKPRLTKEKGVIIPTEQIPPFGYDSLHRHVQDLSAGDGKVRVAKRWRGIISNESWQHAGGGKNKSEKEMEQSDADRTTTTKSRRKICHANGSANWPSPNSRTHKTYLESPNAVKTLKARNKRPSSWCGCAKNSKSSRVTRRPHIVVLRVLCLHPPTKNPPTPKHPTQKPTKSTLCDTGDIVADGKPTRRCR